MGYIRKSRMNILAAVISTTSIAAIAVWQFYLFATFKDANGIFDLHGGTHHLWWAIGTGLVACVLTFLAFSVFVRYDEANEMHITS